MRVSAVNSHDKRVESVAERCRARSFRYQRRCIGEKYAIKLYFGRVDNNVGLREIFLHIGLHPLDFLVGADYTYYIAGVYARASVGNWYVLRTTLYAHDIHAETAAHITVHKTLADKRTA